MLADEPIPIGFNNSGAQIYLKETPTQVFSCDLCELFKNSYFENYQWTAASKDIYLDA